ncbi:MAG: sulfatase-like hydrolase/transferase [Chthoniobacteraceae bacterium]
MAKNLSDIDHVPACWPDDGIVRNDLLDYAFEVEHFDRHLGRMLSELEKRGLLENTLVIVTSDHGMPFPRVKGNASEMANHVPFAAMWKNGIKAPGRTVDDYISFIDLAPTLIEVAGLSWTDTGMPASPGRSLTEIFASEKSGIVIPDRDHVLIGRERTDIGRPHDAGYPIRGIIQDDIVFLENFEPARWPAGNPETGYLDCDGSPSKTLILETHRRDSSDPSWALCFGMRPAEELYDLRSDPDGVTNLATSPQESARASALREQLRSELREQGDPRMDGRGQVFDEYLHANPAHVGSYERFMRGEKMRSGWVKPTDFENVPIVPDREKPPAP